MSFQNNTSIPQMAGASFLPVCNNLTNQPVPQIYNNMYSAANQARGTGLASQPLLTRGIQDFTRDANRAFDRSFPKRRQKRYDNAHVLLITWSDELEDSNEEMNRLSEAFTDYFNFNVEAYYLLPDQTERYLSDRIHEFKNQYADKSHLLVVYYAGHGLKHAGMHCMLGTDSEEPGYEDINWTMIQAILLSSESDVLVILDCCFAGKGANEVYSNIRGNNEIIAASGPDALTSGPPGYSFTKCLTQQLKDSKNQYRDNGTRLSAARLYRMIFQNAKHLRTQPFYMSPNKSGESTSIDVSPLPEAVNAGILASRRSAADWKSSEVGMTQVWPPPAIATVLMSLDVSGYPDESLTTFLRGDGRIPEYVVGARVQGVYPPQPSGQQHNAGTAEIGQTGYVPMYLDDDDEEAMGYAG